MAKLDEIINKIENFAPNTLACDWDNVGWQVFLGNETVNRIMLCLSPTVEVVVQAVEQKCDLIIAHHPMMFDKINKINCQSSVSRAVIKAIQNNTQVYSAHTNLDSAKDGIADKLCRMLDIKNTTPIEKINEETGLGRIGELETEISLTEMTEKIKTVLNTDKIRVINPAGKNRVKKVAVCPGSGGDFISKLKDIDLFITGDVRYHTALEVEDLIVIDAGHLETERIILPELTELLKEFDVEILIAEEDSPWQVV